MPMPGDEYRRVPVRHGHRQHQQQQNPGRQRVGLGRIQFPAHEKHMKETAAIDQRYDAQRRRQHDDVHHAQQQQRAHVAGKSGKQGRRRHRILLVEIAAKPHQADRYGRHADRRQQPADLRHLAADQPHQQPAANDRQRQQHAVFAINPAAFGNPLPAVSGGNNQGFRLHGLTIGWQKYLCTKPASSRI